MTRLCSQPTRLTNRTQSGTTGFTLIELMVTLSIAAILVTLALPAMSDYLRNQRIKTTAFDLISTLTYARSEAIKRNTDIDVSAKSDDWKNGWRVMAGATVLRDHPAPKDLSFSASETTISYGKDGRLVTAVGNITIDVSPSDTDVCPRIISIDLSGRPNSVKGDC